MPGERGEAGHRGSAVSWGNEVSGGNGLRARFSVGWGDILEVCKG